jgi:hypothetical protein
MRARPGKWGRTPFSPDPYAFRDNWDAHRFHRIPCAFRTLRPIGNGRVPDEKLCASLYTARFDCVPLAKGVHHAILMACSAHRAGRGLHGSVPCADVSGQADPHDHPVSAGRGDRPARPAGGAEARRARGPAGCLREPHRRRRQHRRRVHRQGGARRLYRRDRGHPAFDQHEPIQEGQLRPRDRSDRHQQSRDVSEHDRRAPVDADQVDQGADRGGARASRRAQLWRS